MICPKCQSDNPEPNRFCGMCGGPLKESATPAALDAEQSGSFNPSSVMRRPFIVSTTAMADITAQMLNTRVILPSTPIATSSHSGYATPLKPRVERIDHGEDLGPPERGPVDPNDEPMFAADAEAQGSVHEFDLESAEEQEAEEWLERNVAEHEAHMPSPSNGSQHLQPLVQPEPETEEFVEAVAIEPPTEPPIEPPARRDPFFTFDEDPPQEENRYDNNVSGPSFLGLGAPSQDYLLEDEQPASHTRRNLLLLVLVVIVVLGVLEYRASSRGESTNPVDVLHLKMPAKKGQGEVVVVPPSQSAPAPETTDTSDKSVTNNGKPDLIAEPNQSALKKPATTDAQPAATAATPANGASTQVAGSPTGGWSPATTTPTPSKSAAAQSPSSTSPAAAAPKSTEPPAQVAKAAPPVADKPAPAKPSASVSQPDASAKPPASKTAPAATALDETSADASLGNGSAELQKGVAAGSTELGRMWLWKALGKGNGEAPVLLADMYAQGKGVPKDCEQAMLLLNAAAKKVNPRARAKLGSMYAAGECVPQDRVQAYKWMSSALQANPGSDWLEKNRQALLNQMTPAERQRASAIR